MKVKNKILTFLMVLCFGLSIFCFQGCETSNKNQKLEVTAGTNTKFKVNLNATLNDRDIALKDYKFKFTFDTTKNAGGKYNVIYTWWEDSADDPDSPTWEQYSNNEKYSDAKDPEDRYSVVYTETLPESVEFKYYEAVKNGLSVTGFSVKSTTESENERYMTFRLFGVQCLDGSKPKKFYYEVVSENTKHNFEDVKKADGTAGKDDLCDTCGKAQDAGDHY